MCMLKDMYWGEVVILLCCYNLAFFLLLSYEVIFWEAFGQLLECVTVTIIPGQHCSVMTQNNCALEPISALPRKSGDIDLMDKSKLSPCLSLASLVFYLLAQVASHQVPMISRRQVTRHQTSIDHRPCSLSPPNSPPLYLNLCRAQLLSPLSQSFWALVLTASLIGWCIISTLLLDLKFADTKLWASSNIFL